MDESEKNELKAYHSRIQDQIDSLEQMKDRLRFTPEDFGFTKPKSLDQLASWSKTIATYVSGVETTIHLLEHEQRSIIEQING